MITPQEAEQRAQELVKQFVKDAGCRDMQDVANVLTALATVAGMSMANAIGRRKAVVLMSAAMAAVHGAGRGDLNLFARAKAVH